MPSYIEYRTSSCISNIETSNYRMPSHIEYRTSNIEHPVPNIETSKHRIPNIKIPNVELIVIEDKSSFAR